MRPFLMVWNSAQVTVLQQQILAHLDTKIEIQNYYTPFLGTILLVAQAGQTPSSLSWLVHNRFPNLQFAITPVDQWGTNGWMPQIFWDLINNPKSSGRWPSGPQQNSSSIASLLEQLAPKRKP